MPHIFRTLFAHQTVLTSVSAHFSHTNFRKNSKRAICAVGRKCLYDKYLRKLNIISHTKQVISFLDFGSEGLGFESLWVYLIQALCKFKTYKGFCVFNGEWGNLHLHTICILLLLFCKTNKLKNEGAGLTGD